ncbi:PRC-barrel domain-containing protein [Paractinoplanes lichenicola]|uniref:PRC-barrel domain-containing protein n=1 Tax=Paractinoplanes lichenicola TaxID=2802976 RepID=A0ABS1VLA6_9ACTN|nr:PRC-barrel domain-containing protein [Actinoplanes lichenicola]MBL7255518.1 PRC-barrel domain-containing protein [Actinoplanes lichenicola]
MRLLIGFDLLDRQIVDRDGVPVGKVDDVELSEDARTLTALLTGQSALGGRFGGVLGRWITAAAGGAEPRRIPYDLVAKVDSAVHLAIKRELLAPPALEKWLDDHLIGRIPGADNAES